MGFLRRRQLREDELSIEEQPVDHFLCISVSYCFFGWDFIIINTELFYSFSHPDGYLPLLRRATWVHFFVVHVVEIEQINAVWVIFREVAIKVINFLKDPTSGDPTFRVSHDRRCFLSSIESHNLDDRQHRSHCLVYSLTRVPQHVLLEGNLHRWSMHSGQVF